ncbi:unnamed protein product [Anisakis simplex]|uniref:CRIM domain-containing protein n=1 Tax=Anisakis simplex TaxID=6269 RepID=A0A0M3K4A8_ANISI|nr:unnamed protein product [Anisakis simplex]
MAYISKADLIDALKHEFGADDETGLCTKILGPASRRPKPGGLPLGFRQDDSSYESDEEQYSPGYLAYFDELSTQGIIQSRLRSRTVENEKISTSKSGASCTTVIVPGRYHMSMEARNRGTPKEEPFRKTQKEEPTIKIYKVQPTGETQQAQPIVKTHKEDSIKKTTHRNEPTRKTHTVEATKQSHKEESTKKTTTHKEESTKKTTTHKEESTKKTTTHKEDIRGEFKDASSGRQLMVFYPFADAKNDETLGCMLNLRVLPKTKISDLIGFCCYAYMRNNRTPPISDPSQYRLLMAEENGEVDRDLPPIDGHRSLAELGSCWSTVALVHRSEITSAPVHSEVTVMFAFGFAFANLSYHRYTVSGGCYVFELDTLDVPLSWLRDRALERRIEEEGDSFLCSSDYPELREYLLETLNEPDVALNLEATIASTACTEFLLIRKNSSRGDFQMRRPSIMSDFDAMTPLATTTMQRSISTDLYSARIGDTSALTTPVSPSPVTPEGDPELGSLLDDDYTVEWLHRYKPKWSARLGGIDRKLFIVAMHDLGFELRRCQSERKRSLTLLRSPTQKYLKVLWDHVGAVDIVADHGTGS